MTKFNSKTAAAAAKKKAASEKSGGSDRAFWKKVKAATRWALEHPVDDEPPTEMHRTLQQAKKKDPLAFMDRVFKQLSPKGEGGGGDTDGQEDGCADFLATVDQMLGEMKCPSTT